jgi:hypothetical protein
VSFLLVGCASSSIYHLVAALSSDYVLVNSGTWK